MSQETNKRVVLAGFLIVIGFFWIFKNFDLLPDFIPDYLFSWQIIFVLVGIFILLTRRAVLPGLIFIAIGLFLIFPNIPRFDFIQIWMLWPILLIAIGMSLLLQHRTRHEGDQSMPKDDSRADYLDELTIFGGGEKIINAQNFRGGKITTIFGGSEINLLNSKLAKGSVYIDIASIFGGCTLIVPQHWNVKVDMVSIFGGFSDKRALSTETESKDDSILYIKGVSIFGGGEVKSYK